MFLVWFISLWRGEPSLGSLARQECKAPWTPLQAETVFKRIGSSSTFFDSKYVTRLITVHCTVCCWRLASNTQRLKRKQHAQSQPCHDQICFKKRKSAVHWPGSWCLLQIVPGTWDRLHLHPPCPYLGTVNILQPCQTGTSQCGAPQSWKVCSSDKSCKLQCTPQVLLATKNSIRCAWNWRNCYLGPDKARFVWKCLQGFVVRPWQHDQKVVCEQHWLLTSRGHFVANSAKADSYCLPKLFNKTVFLVPTYVSTQSTQLAKF